MRGHTLRVVVIRLELLLVDGLPALKTFDIVVDLSLVFVQQVSQLIDVAVSVFF